MENGMMATTGYTFIPGYAEYTSTAGKEAENHEISFREDSIKLTSTKDPGDLIPSTLQTQPVSPRGEISLPLESKPLSTGKVRVRDRALEVDFDGDGIYSPFVVKGAAFSPKPIGYGVDMPLPKEIYDRSIEYLAELGANTIRTYSGADRYLLDRAAEKNIRTIVGFWVPYDMDLSIEKNRQSVIDKFKKMVEVLKDSPGVLMWNLGNEQNYASNPNNGSSTYWYSLAQDLAKAAYEVEGDCYHPVCVNNGGLSNIGDKEKMADDKSLTCVDLWAANIYQMDFTPEFEAFRTKTEKPIVLTEWGIDALDHRTGGEYEDVQAAIDVGNWKQFREAQDVCVGGTVFEFTDEWWKAGDSLSHDAGGYPTGAHPDGYSNEEWYGLIAVTADSNNDGLDEWRPRKAFYALKKEWEK